MFAAGRQEPHTNIDLPGGSCLALLSAAVAPLALLPQLVHVGAPPPTFHHHLSPPLPTHTHTCCQAVPGGEEFAIKMEASLKTWVSSWDSKGYSVEQLDKGGWRRDGVTGS